MHFLRLFLAFIEKLYLLSFHFSNNSGGGGLENFQKLISGGGTIIQYSRVLFKRYFWVWSGTQARFVRERPTFLV